MNALRRLFWREPSASEAASALAKEGVRQRHNRILERTAQMRRELGLPPSPALHPR